MVVESFLKVIPNVFSDQEAAFALIVCNGAENLPVCTIKILTIYYDFSTFQLSQDLYWRLMKV